MNKNTALLLAVFLIVFPLFAAAVPETKDNTELVNGHNLTSGSPWLASCVEGTIGNGTVASLKDDYYLYANLERLVSEKILPGYSSAGLLFERTLQNDEDMLSLFADNSDADSEDSRLALDLFGMFMDWDERNRLGVGPLKKVIDGVEKMTDIDALSRHYTTAPYQDNLAFLFPASYTVDFKDSSRYVLFLASSMLLLEDSAEYTNLTEAGRIKKDAISDLIIYVLCRLGYSEAEARKKLDNCFALETKLAASIMTSDEKNAPDAIMRRMNYYSVEELEKAQGDVPLLGFIDNLGYKGVENVMVFEPEWLDNLTKLYNEDNLELIKDYLIVWTSLAYVNYLDKDCFTHSLDYGNAISGVNGYLPDEQYALSQVQSCLPWQIAKLYCEKFVTENDKEKLKNIAEKVIENYSEMLSGNSLLADETKERAKKKLQSMIVRSLYPDDWSPYSYSGLVLKENEDGSLLDAIKKISVAQHKKGLEFFSKPVDKTYWNSGDPTVVNAFYYMSDNSINMLAAFCSGEIYNSKMPLEEVFAKIGFVIGHEVSHAFDGTGSNFDEKGNVNNWWSDEDRNLFNGKIDLIAEYANKATYWDDVHLNGAIMTGEICADMGGMAVMLRMAKDIPGFNYDLFFRSFAELWESIQTYNKAVASMSDVHPADFFRVNSTLQQFDEFRDYYGIKKGDGMYLADGDRVAVW